MTASHPSLRIPRWLLAAGLCGVLLAQMALPALHAIERSSSAPDVLTSQPMVAGAIPVARAAQPGATHDPATCPLCQSLLRSNSLMTSPAPRSDASIAYAPALPMAPTRAWDAVAQIGHPSRAPPLRTLHLA